MLLAGVGVKWAPRKQPLVSTEVYRWYLRVASSQTGLPPQLELSGGDSP